MIQTLLRAAALSALLLLAACDRQSTAAGVPAADLPKNLRVYTVPAERAEGLRDALAGALGDSGRVSLAPPDRLIVVAPVALQTSVAENLGELMKAAPAAPADSGPVRLMVWIVDVADAEVLDPRLRPLQPTLEALRESLAAPGFTLYGQLAITSSDMGAHMPQQQANDGRANLSARLKPTDGGVHASIEVQADRMSARTQTRLKFGETVVLAQAMPEDAGGARVRLVIVRADPAS